MGEQEPSKEFIGQGELLYLWHPETEGIFSGYGLTLESGQKDHLVGLLMVDRPRPADPGSLQAIHNSFGECHLVPMTTSGDRGLVCQMKIDADSISHLCRFPSSLSEAIQAVLEPLIEQPPAPVLNLSWDDEAQLWLSEIATTNELPREIQDVFETKGYGCLAVETNIGVVHVCHARGSDIEGFANKQVRSRWQLIGRASVPSSPCRVSHL